MTPRTTVSQLVDRGGIIVFSPEDVAALVAVNDMLAVLGHR